MGPTPDDAPAVVEVEGRDHDDVPPASPPPQPPFPALAPGRRIPIWGLRRPPLFRYEEGGPRLDFPFLISRYDMVAFLSGGFVIVDEFSSL